MINTLSGTIVAINDTELTFMVGPIGVALHVPDGTQFTPNQQIQLHTYLHWNQEQGPTLYGFSSLHEKTVFLLVISCNGLGPKIALAVVRSLSPATFFEAISTNEPSILSKVNGIGAKKAEQMVVQLKHKVTSLLKAGTITDISERSLNLNNISEVLESLHYKRNEITAALAHLHKEHNDPSLSFDQLVRHALSFLAKKT